MNEDPRMIDEFAKRLGQNLHNNPWQRACIGMTITTLVVIAIGYIAALPSWGWPILISPLLVAFVLSALLLRKAIKYKYQETEGKANQ